MQTKVLFEFGPFRFDPAEQRLLRDGKPISLPPKAFDLLQAFLHNNGRLLTKEELMRHIWPNSFVEEANLTVTISTLRRALGERSGDADYIQTVPKRGYRFVADVTELLEQGDGAGHHQIRVAAPEEVKAGAEIRIGPSVVPRSESPHPSSTAARIPAPVRGRIPVLAFLVLALAVAGVFLYRQRTEGPRTSAHLHRLAILPFENLRHDPDSDFLGYSLADAVITKLGYVQALQVRPSYAIAKYRNQTVEIRKVAADLNVDTLLTGTFIRDGDDLRITCQLLDAATEDILWQGAFDLKYDRLLSVHDEVARQIISGLELHLSPTEAQQFTTAPPVNASAYEYYLRGVDLYSRSEFPLAARMLEEAAEIDPGQALTWAYLGRTYNASASFELGGQDHYRKAQAAFEKALALQPTQIEANVYTANWLTDTGRVEEAVPLLRKALQTNPSHAEVHWELGYAYRFAGMLKESVDECERARALDPGVKLNSSALNTYLYVGQYERFLQSLPPRNDNAFITFYRGFAEYHQKRWDAAARDFDRAYELDPNLLQAQVGKALSYAISKHNDQGLEILRATEETIRLRGVGDSEAIYKMAQAYAALGDMEGATRVLRRSIDKGFFAYSYFVTDPLIASLRKQPDVVKLLETAQARQEAFRKKFF